MTTQGSQIPTLAGDMTPEDLRSIAALAMEAASATSTALNAQAAHLSTLSGVKTRKPEIPDFDAKNVEVWLKRTQSAYDRAGIVLPKDKFAFLESKFKVGANPKVDEFLYGEANEETWLAFTHYLCKEYGRTVQQEARFIRGKHSRDGRRPSQMVAQILDKTRKVSLEDVVKDIIIAALPDSVQQCITDKVQHLDMNQTANLADLYFDQDGKELHPSTSPVHAVINDSTEDDDDHTDEEGDVNAIKERFKRSANPPKTPSYSGSASKNATFNQPKRFPKTPSKPKSPPKSGFCRYHERFGDKARRCQQPCSFKRAPKAEAGNRM